MKTSQRSAIQSFIVMDVMEEVARQEAQGRDIIHMQVGQPGSPAPATARHAAAAALEKDNLGYTVALGRPQLRQRIADYYRDVYNVDVSADRIVVTTGSSAGFVLSFLALFDVGDRVALPAPGYPCYRHILSTLGQKVEQIETGPVNRWMPTVEALERLHKTSPLRGLILASPANPTGTVLPPRRLAEIMSFCQANDIQFISDEIYHGLTYEGPATSAATMSEQAIVINSFSKYFSMTGWRIGWLVVPETMTPVIERLAQNLYISPSTISQVAALGAFDGLQELEANRDNYAQNRERLIAAFKTLGLGNHAPPDGGFYFYVDVRHLTDDSRVFARQMLDEAGVAVTPGVDFDERDGARFIRFCYAATKQDIDEAIRRLQSWDRLKAG
jgi:aspartate/methionine/tyrosine aminotransferase